MIGDRSQVRSVQSFAGFAAVLPAADAVALALTSVLAVWIRNGLDITQAESIGIATYLLISGIGVIALNYSRGQYRCLPEYFGFRDALELSKNVVVAISLASLCAFILHRMDAIARGIVVIQALLFLSALVSIRLAVKFFVSRQMSKARWDEIVNVLVVGISPLAALYIDAVEGMGLPHVKVIGVLADKQNCWANSISGKKILGSVHEIAAVLKVLETHGVKVGRVVIALPRGHLPKALAKEVRAIADLHGLILEQLGEILGIPAPTDSWAARDHLEAEYTWYSPVKRAFDIVGAVFLLLFLSPVLILTSVLVLIDVGWPCVFWQDRPGRYGVPFRLYKFRTMRTPIDAEGRPVPIDMRASLLGGLIRRTRLDELLQLFNVLVGQMSLIGPRPLLPVDQPRDVDRRLSVRPGITGWAQVNGGQLLPVTEKTALDIWYTEAMGPLLDLKIALLTVKTVIFGEKPNPAAVSAASAPRPSKVPVGSADIFAGESGQGGFSLGSSAAE